MPRQFGKVDASVTWACPDCPYRHTPGAWCPEPGVWLVLAICPHCDPKKSRYCSTHRDRNQPHLEVVTIPPPPGRQDDYRARIGERGAA